MFKNILFDFDGTLVDTNELVIEALNKAAEKFTGKRLSAEKLNSVLGYYLEEQMRMISGQHYKEMTAYYSNYYKSMQDLMVKDFPGIKEMLEALKRQGCRMAIISAKGRNGIEHGLKKYAIGQYFDVVVSARDVENNKPHPEPAIKAMKLLSANKEDTLLVGDSPLDMQCGRASGIKTVLVGWTIFPKEKFVGLEPDFYVKSPQEIIDIALQDKI
jgi:pyrophosphatase PpaX